MSNEETNQKLTALQLLLPMVLLLGMDYLGTTLNGVEGVSQYSLAIFITEILLLIVFIKGEICNGQRGRLIKANHYLALFWGIWFIVAVLQGAIVSIASSLIGFAILVIISRQLLFRVASGLSILGFIAYFYSINQLNEIPLRWLCFNPILQLLLGVILANILLLISRNRLQGFIALLPFIMAILLVINVFYTLGVLFFLPEPISVIPDMSPELPLLLYFLLHIMMMTIIGIHILRKIKFDYFNLILLFFIATSLPIWVAFLVG